MKAGQTTCLFFDVSVNKRISIREFTNHQSRRSLLVLRSFSKGGGEGG